jgi:hypothetical protein
MPSTLRNIMAEAATEWAAGTFRLTGQRRTAEQPNPRHRMRLGGPIGKAIRKRLMFITMASGWGTTPVAAT